MSDFPNEHSAKAFGCIPTSEAIAQGVLPRTGRGFHILAAGQLNFIDGFGATINMAAGFWTAGQVYPYMVTEILSGTTATGRVVY